MNTHVQDLPASFPTGPMATDDASFYWTTSTMLRSVPKAGAPLGVDTSVTLTNTNWVDGLAVDGSSIYWGDIHGNLLSLPKTGGTAPKTLAGKSASKIVLDASDLYFADGTGVFRLPLAGGPVTTLANVPDVRTFALDATNVYCRTGSDVIRFPKSGGMPTNLLHAAGDTLVLLGSKLYVDNVVGGLVQFAVLPVEGGTPVLLDLGAPRFSGLTGYDGALYLVNDGTAIRRVPVDGSAPTEVKISGFGPPRDLVVDSSGVYWMNSRSSCQLETVYPSQGRSDPGSSTCDKGLFETLVLRLPAVF